MAGLEKRCPGGVPVAGNVRVAAVVARLHGWYRVGVAATLAAAVVSHLLFAVVKRIEFGGAANLYFYATSDVSATLPLKSPTRNLILPLLAESKGLFSLAPYRAKSKSPNGQYLRNRLAAALPPKEQRDASLPSSAAFSRRMPVSATRL